MKVAVRKVLIVLASAVMLFSACGKKTVKASRPNSPRPTAVAIPAPKVGDTEIGVASWYGHPYHGRAAADGEIYDMEKLTAAHRTLPFNTWVSVENLGTHQIVELRIIDRGPFVNNRVIDVSHAAAEKIGLIGPGVARVRIIVVATPPVPEAAIFAVQVGIFSLKANAEKLQTDLRTRYGIAHLVEREGSPPSWRVLVGSEETPEKAEVLAVRVRRDISVPQAYVVRLDRP